MIEFNEDKRDIHRQVDDLRREQRLHDVRQTQTIQELTEMNLKLAQDLQIVSREVIKKKNPYIFSPI